MYTATQIKSDRGTVFYKGQYLPVQEFNEPEQLFQIEVEGSLLWIRAEKYTYIPF